jgi:hypothetical protein
MSTLPIEGRSQHAEANLGRIEASLAEGNATELSLFTGILGKLD